MQSLGGPHGSLSTGHGNFHGSQPTSLQSRNAGHRPRIVTYREFVQPGLSPRMLAQAIAERTGREQITEVFLSPDAFAHRTAEASIAEQLGDILMANGLPRPCAADDDRIGGWQLMYQLLQGDEWLITDHCAKLIECIPQLVRDDRRPEDIRKIDGDDPADAARYGLVSGARLAGLNSSFGYAGSGFGPSQAATFNVADPTQAHARHDSDGERGAGNWPHRDSQSPFTGSHFVHGMPLGEQIARQVRAEDATSRAIHYQRLEAEARRFFRPKPLPRRRA